MSTQLIPVKLKHADPDSIAPDDLPILPEWYPLDPKGGPRYTAEQRAEQRAGRAKLEALQGPYDGERGQVATQAGGGPPLRLLYADGAVVYSLDLRASRGAVAVYRYDPAASPSHRGCMAAVAEAYHDHGKSYADDARQGERQDRPGPEAI